MSKFSLDPENQKIYGARAKQWQNKADEIGEQIIDGTVEKISESGIIKSNLEKRWTILCTISERLIQIFTVVLQKIKHSHLRWKISSPSTRRWLDRVYPERCRRMGRLPNDYTYSHLYTLYRWLFLYEM
jgi:hypothetical protein